MALGGCAAFAPVPALPARALPELPAQWSQAEGPQAAPAQSLGHWWQRFDDPLLNDLIALALQANTRVESAQAALQQARALSDVARAQQLPTLGASASLQRARSGNSSSENRVGLGLDAAWELDLFGARRSAVDGRVAVERARSASLGDAQVSVAAEVALNLIDLRSAQARRTLADANAESQQETLQLTQWRVQAGLATSLESEQARAALQQTLAQIAPLATVEAQAMHALAVLCGLAPAALRCTAGWPRRRRSHRRHLAWRSACPPTRCASARMCARPKPRSMRHWVPWPRPTRRASRACVWGARWA